ncbi:MAG: restriction endonuclease subunit S [Enterovibrio sp.]
MSNLSQVSSYLASFNGNTVPLENLCISITDCPHSTPKWTDNGLIVLRSNNIKGGVLDLSAPSYTDPLSFQERIKRATPEAGDIVITREAPMGEVCLIPDGLKCCLGQRMVLLKVDPTKISSQYLLFALQSEFVQKQIRKSDRTGSTVSNLCIPDLKALEIPVLFNTDGIAAILKSITGKIELNNHINAELEAMAKTLYGYWFVQFNFPDDLGKPYKSSGGKMVYNPTLKREIPEGWEVVPVGDYANVKKGTLITEKDANQHGNIKVVSAGLNYSYLHDEANYSANVITISASGASAGFINFWREPIFACDCTVVKGNSDEETIYLLNFLKMRQEFIYQQARGSAQPHVYPKDISALNIEVPPKGLLEKFKAHVLDGNSEISNRLLQNQKLAVLRDWLLPMLMNGQVTVGEAS